MIRIYLITILALTVFEVSYGQDNSKLINDYISDDIDNLTSFYKTLHASPELSFHEEATSATLANELRQLGVEVTEEFGGFGVVGVFMNGNGPVIMVRTDTDGLPIKEQTGLDYASQVTTKDDQGKTVHVGHACGHDVHMSVFIGTARCMIKYKDQWSGTLLFVAQPAEERGSGARIMLEEGLFEKFPKPDVAYALHVNATLPAGSIGHCSGYALASVDMIDLSVYGNSGHGAYPHTAIDPVVLSARIVLALQTIVSREIKPIEPAVVTVGSIHGGTKHNIIPEEVKMELTLRSYSDEVRQQILDAINRITAGIAASAGLPESKYPKMTIRDEHTPSVYNDPELSDYALNIFTQVLAEDQIILVDPVMGGEDFAYYGRQDHKVPIHMYWLGAVKSEKYDLYKNDEVTLPPLHSSFFAPDPEPSITTGVLTMSSLILSTFQKKHKTK